MCVFLHACVCMQGCIQDSELGGGGGGGQIELPKMLGGGGGENAIWEVQYRSTETGGEGVF